MIINYIYIYNYLYIYFRYISQFSEQSHKIPPTFPPIPSEQPPLSFFNTTVLQDVDLANDPSKFTLSPGRVGSWPVATVAQRAAALKTGCLIWGDHYSSTSQRFFHMFFLLWGDHCIIGDETLTRYFDTCRWVKCDHLSTLMEDHCDMTWDVIVNAMGFNGYGI